MSTDNKFSLKIYYQNVRGLRSKTLNFYRNLCLNSFDVIILTETWLVDGIANSELFDDRYLVWRRDRDYVLTDQNRGGGVLIATRRDICATSEPFFQSTAEDLWVTLSLRHSITRKYIKLHLCVLYLCKQNLGLSFTDQLLNFLTNLTDTIFRDPLDKYMIVGDFNMSNISWMLDDNFLSPTNIYSNYEILLIDDLHTHDLKQYNGVVNSHGRILDLVLCNEPVYVSECHEPLLPIDSYHPALCIDVNWTEFSILKPVAFIKPLFNKGDYESINIAITSIDWVTELSTRSFEEGVEFFYSTVNNLIYKHIPKKYCRSDSYPAWYSPALRKAIKEKFKYFRKFKTYGNRSDRNTFNYLRRRVKVLEVACYNNYIDLIENSISNNAKCFWSYVHSRSKHTGMPSSLKYGDSVLNDGESICNAFSNYFYSTFLDSNQCSDHLNFPRSNIANESISDISNIEITIEDVSKQISNLDPSKSAGPDNIPPRFLLSCVKSIALPISIIFKRSLSENIIPRVWKTAFITPIHKKGAKNEVTNYRPISKLCTISKILEKIIYNQVYSALKYSFNSFQHGFLKGKSTVTNLILFNDFLTNSMSNGKQVDVIYTDYSKAFDKINHKILIIKLNNIGIRGDLLRWFTSYVENRCQAVVINNYISSWVTIPSGVPQGSLLGPLLFIIFINDIQECFHSTNLLAFADDMKIFASISCPTDTTALQSDLSRLDNYCARNQLYLNPTKCFVTTFTRKAHVTTSDYYLKGHKIQRSDLANDLGVIHDSKLIFDQHIDKICTRATKALGFVMRNSECFKNVKTFKILYCSFVRSILEYASQVWNPCYNKYISRIENIQKKFVKYICFRLKVKYSSNNYHQLCKKFHLLPLVARRDVADVVFLLKLISNSIDCPEILHKIHFNIPNKSSRIYNPIRTELVPSNYHQNTYLRRVGNNFNRSANLHNLDLFHTSAASARGVLSRSFFET